MQTTANSQPGRRGFTLVETLIAVAIVVMLLTAFVAAFGPAMRAIRHSIDIQEADRLVSAARQQLELLRPGQNYPTHFDKAIDWIENSHDAGTALLVYQYRATIGAAPRADGSPPPYTAFDGIPGKDFSVQPIMRQNGDSLIEQDFDALEGRVFTVKFHQLVTSDNGDPEWVPSDDPTTIEGAEELAVLPFTAEFHALPISSHGYLASPAFSTFYDRVLSGDSRPVFTRNLAVRR